MISLRPHLRSQAPCLCRFRLSCAGALTVPLVPRVAREQKEEDDEGTATMPESGGDEPLTVGTVTAEA